jgi:hypothetical protein
MEFKKYIALELDGYKGVHKDFDTVKIKIKNGLTSEDMKESLDSDWTPAEKDRLYFFPGCAVPRFKVREKFNTTIKPEYATAAFISSQGLKASERMFDVINNAVKVDGQYMAEYFEHIYGKSHHFVLKYKSLLLNCEDDVILDNNAMYKLIWYCPEDARNSKDSIRQWRHTHHYEEYSDVFIPKSDELNFYSPVVNSDLDKLTCPIYSQDAILRILNDDNIVINEKKYEELRLMANSEDDENLILVMELMANANYKKSFVYLLLLLKEFQAKIAKQKRAIDHVNFKALLHFLDLDKKQVASINIEMLMTGMKKHKQFTRANVQRVTQFFADGNTFSETDHFISGPVLKPEAESMLDDYTIEDEVEVPEPEQDENFNL